MELVELVEVVELRVHKGLDDVVPSELVVFLLS
jgi:hypothetical protein